MVYFLNRYILISLSLLFIVTKGYSQQEILFSQVSKSLEFVNPAYNASKENINAVLIHRNQWTGFEGAPRTYALNLHSPVFKSNFGSGATIIHEQIGLRNITYVGLNFDVNVKLSRSISFAAGLMGGAELLSYDTEDIIAYSEVPDEYVDNQTIPGIGAGLYLFSKSFQIGVSSFSTLDNESNKSYTDQLNVNANISYIQRIYTNWHLKPYFLCKYYTNYLNTFEGGIMVLFKDLFWIGGAYRYKSAAIAMADIRITQFFRIGYSYDASIGSVKDLSTNTHEIRLSFQLANKPLIKTPESTGR